MPSNAVRIGPFSGGLNSYSDPSAVGDQECVNIQNFDVDLDGSLYSRPPIIIQDAYPNIPGVGRMKLLGWFINTDSERYLIGSTDTATFQRKESTGIWTSITGNIAASAMVQYANKAYLVAPPGSANPGGSWTPAGGFIAIAAMVKGAAACIYKERLFIAGGKLDATNANRIFFSNAADFATWTTATNFFDVRAGDGEHIVDILVFQDSIVIFKENSTYVFSYDSSPSRGAVRVVNTAIGCGGPNTVVEYENSLYLYHNNSMYQLNNWNFTLINLKVPFVQNILFPTLGQEATVSILFDRLIVRYFDNIYVFGLRTGVWTKWIVDSSHIFDYWVEIPRSDITEPKRYYAASRQGAGGQSNRCLFEFTNTWNAVDSEEMECFVTSKVYDFNVAHTFKRLFWWGVELISKKDLSYIVHPISYTTPVTHQMMSAFTHQEIVGTYAQPLDVSIDVTDSLVVTNIAGNRMFIKLLKSLRFRQISLTISGTNDGTSIEGPLRIFGATVFVDNKEQVVKQVN